MPKFRITETIHSEKIKTVRLGQAGVGLTYGYSENGKAVKLTAESRYELCAMGDTLEGYITSVEGLGNVANATLDGYTVGGICSAGYKDVTFDGSQAAGTGVIAIGDYLVVGTVDAKGTKLTTPALKMRKATDQAAARTALVRARVVSLGDVGTGAVGTVGVVELS